MRINCMIDEKEDYESSLEELISVEESFVDE